MKIEILTLLIQFSFLYQCRLNIVYYIMPLSVPHYNLT